MLSNWIWYRIFLDKHTIQPQSRQWAPFLIFVTSHPVWPWLSMRRRCWRCSFGRTASKWRKQMDWQQSLELPKIYLQNRWTNVTAWKFLKRMHSDRIHTARSLLYRRSLSRVGLCPAGLCPEGTSVRQNPRPTPLSSLWTEWLTYTCKNITLP